MTGWVPPPASGGGEPVVGWVVPSEPSGLGVGDCAREGWQITKAQLGPLVAITAIPAILLNLLYIPFWISIATMLEGIFRFWAELDISRYQYDPEALQRDMQAAMQPTQELSIIASAATGVAVVIGIVSLAALTAGTLDAAAGRTPSISGAFRVTLGRAAVVVPAVILGIGYVVVFVPLALVQPEWVYGGAMTGAPGLAALLSVVVLVLEAIAIYLAIRWSLYFQVVVAEDLGIRASLARAAALSSGVRVRIAVVMIVLWLLVGFVVAFVAAIPAVVLGLATQSIIAALVTGTVVLSLCALVYLPYLVAVLTYIYRRRAADTASA
jgi:hypothetical protein